MANHRREPLFVDRRRSNGSEATESEPIWDFLNRVDDPAFDRVRRLMNDWFSRYPMCKRHPLRQLMSTRLDDQFHAAWFELYLHELHIRIGWDVTVEPSIQGSAREPDFLVSQGDKRVLIEATIVGDGLDRSRLQRRNSIVESLSRIESPDFDLWFEIEREGSSSPRVSRVRSEVESWLQAIDWNESANRERISGFRDLPTLVVAAGDWKFSVQALARSELRRGSAGSPLIGPSDGGIFDHSRTILDRLERKAKQCKAFHGPTIIAVRMDGIGADDEDLRVALMGPSIGRMMTVDGEARVIDTGRHGKGFFRSADGTLRNRQILGVLAWDSELRPWSITKQQPRLWLNPGSEFGELGFPWRQALLGDPRFVEGSFDPRTVFVLPDASLFEDPADWPGRPFKSGA